MLVLAVALAGCTSGTPIDSWTLFPPGEARGAPVELPARFELPNEPSEYRLRADVPVPNGLRGQKIRFEIPYFTGRADLVVQGRRLALAASPLVSGYRSEGAQAWEIPSELTDTERIEIELRVEHRWTQSAWLTTVPRLVPTGSSAAHTVWTRIVNEVFGLVAFVALGQIGFVYLAIYLADRRRRLYLFFAIQGMGATLYPLFITGYSQGLFGTYDVNLMGAALCVAAVSSVHFAHALFDRGKASIFWNGLASLGVITTLGAVGPFRSTFPTAVAVAACVGAAAAYQIYICAKLLRSNDPPPGVAFVLAAWVFLVVGASNDIFAWLGIAEILGGARAAGPALAMFGVFQSMLLSRQHAVTLARSDDLNVELAGQVEQLEGRQEEIEHLNEELRRQIADRSRQLFAALALVGGGSTASVSFSPGDVIQERYRIKESIGKGGMGQVYAVERLSDGRMLALKVAQGFDGKDLARLAREAHIAARLSHPNVVAVVDVDVANTGIVYLILELVDGPTLGGCADRFVETRWSLDVLAQIAEGLTALHDAEIIHRDLKPDNVLVSGDIDHPVVKLVDFGISRVLPGLGPTTTPRDGDTLVAVKNPRLKVEAPSPGNEGTTLQSPLLTAALKQTGSSSSGSLTETGLIAGTPGYMAPELINVDVGPTAAADVFSFGVMAIELLTGRSPFPEPPMLAKIAGHLKPVDPGALDRADLPVGVQEVLLGAAALEPSDRPTAHELAEKLREAADGTA